MRRLWRALIWCCSGLVVIVLLLLAPVAYVETFCGADPDQTAYTPLITEPQFQRKEANSYLTYPEWHIVYAYEGLAKVLEGGDEHEFSYFTSVSGFWKSFCALNRIANRHGGGDFNTRATVHTIGVSFTLEMGMKALYEETVGRLFAAIRGSEKTPQDKFSAEMAADYGKFLHQVPWYKYDFDKATVELWQQPLSAPVRGWERRLALSGEWKAKSAYAKLIAQAVAAAGQAQLRIRSVVKNVRDDQILKLEGVNIVENSSSNIVIETPRYRKFTNILQTLTLAGGQIVEIAGNDDIMLSVIEAEGLQQVPLKNGTLISRIRRDGYESNRLLLAVKVRKLAELLKELAARKLELEHVYDY